MAKTPSAGEDAANGLSFHTLLEGKQNGTATLKTT